MRSRIRLILILSLVLALFGCRREDIVPSSVTDEDMAELCVRVRIPEYNFTKSGEVAAQRDESVIKNLFIWIYLSEDFDDTRKSGYCIGYITPNQDQHEQTQYEDRYFVRIPRDIALAKPNVDVYVVANRNSVGVGNNSNMSRSTLDAFLMKGTTFGVDSDGVPTTSTSEISSNGLPYSAVGKNLSMGGTFPSLTIPTVTLKRAVSKVRFVVSQLADAAGPVQTFTLDEISLNQDLISSSEYLFNDSANNYKLSGYVSETVKFPAPAYADIAQNQSPQDYAFTTGMNLQDYEDMVLEGISEGVLTDIGPYYLRETDKALSGNIKYTMSGKEQQTVSFTMNAAGGFTRNHSWIVYIYFTRDYMQFTVSWTDWEQGLDFNLAQ